MEVVTHKHTLTTRPWRLATDFSGTLDRNAVERQGWPLNVEDEGGGHKNAGSRESVQTLMTGIYTGKRTQLLTRREGLKVEEGC